MRKHYSAYAVWRLLFGLAFTVILGGTVPGALSISASAQTEAHPQPRLRWNAMWIAHPTAPLREPAVFHFRRVVRLESPPTHFRVHVSADNRFVLFVNGKRIGEGPARADLSHWRYETFDIADALRLGDNIIAALVWQHGIYAPLSQFSDRAAFMLEGDSAAESAVNTDDKWEVEYETGHTFLPRTPNNFWDGYSAVGPGDRIDAIAMNWTWKDLPLRNGRWVKAAPAIRENIYPTASMASSRDVAFETSWGLVPDPLPQMEYSPITVGHVVRTDLAEAHKFPSSPIQVPAHTTATLLLDLGTVTTAYPELTLSGGKGASVTLRYAEALYNEKHERYDRNAVGNLQVLTPIHDEFLADGARRTFSTLYWRTWRYLEVVVKTANEPLRLEDLHAYFSAYPFVERAKFDSDDPELKKVWEICWRGARLGAHENYVDTPFWEQLQYVGDTRLQSLISYTVANDDRLAKQALHAFDDSRRPDGLTQSRYPSTLPQYIPPFSLLYVNVLHDYWMYRPDPATVRELLPGTRAVLQWFIDRQRADGFLKKLPYWRFVDTPTGYKGWPPPEVGEWPSMDSEGRSSVHTLQFVGALLAAAEMEEALGNPTIAQMYRSKAKLASEAVYRSCWNPDVGLIADTPEQKGYSQQANLYAVLFDVVPANDRTAVMRKLLAPDVAAHQSERAPAMAHVSYFFTFYLARAMQHAGFGNDYLQLLTPWRGMPAKGLTSTPEYPDPTRSDTHAWSAHPIYDMLTTVAGIAPAAPGFAKVRIEPNLGSLKNLDATMPHPAGMIHVQYKLEANKLHAAIELPKGVDGTFIWNGKQHVLNEGFQTFVAE